MNNKARTNEESEGVINMLKRLEEEGFEDYMGRGDSTSNEYALAMRLQRT